MRLNGKAVSGGVALLLASWAAPASALPRCVNPAGGTCYTTIQAAVFASLPGDVITIAAGTYPESVVIPTGKDGLQLKGAGTVIIDNEIQTGVTSTVLTVNSSYVSLSGLTIRNGRSDGIDVYGKAFSMTSVKVLGADSDCVYLSNADFSVIKGSQLTGCGSYGVELNGSDFVTVTGTKIGPTDYGVYGTGNNFTFAGNTVFNSENYWVYLYGNKFGATITSNTMDNAYSDGLYFSNVDFVKVSKNKLTNTDSAGIYIYGDSPIVTYNTLTNAYSDGIDVYGSSAQITNNTINYTDGAGIYLTSGPTDSDNAVVAFNSILAYPGSDGMDIYGNGATIQSNVVANAYDGIYVSGDDPRVLSNTVSNLEGYGIDVECTNPCTGGVVQLNKVTNVTEGKDGFYINAPNATAPMQVLTNTASMINYDCFYITGRYVNAVGNKGTDCGYYTHYGSGFEVYGLLHTLTSNVILRTAADGYYIEAPGSQLVKNVSDSAGEDGFDVHASVVTLDSNKAINNAGTGFEVNDFDQAFLITLTGTNLTSNTATGNALGACISSSATSTTQTTNSYGIPYAPAACSEAAGAIGN